MPKLTNPSEIAREALKLLATRRLVPTPDNYLTIYNEIAGLKTEDSAVEKMLQQLVSQLPSSTPALTEASAALKKHLAAKDWTHFAAAWDSYLKSQESRHALPWAGLIKELIRVWETKHTGLTMAKKRDGLETVLQNFGANPEALYPKLQNLFKSWSSGGISQSELAPAEIPPEQPEHAATAEVAAIDTSESLRGLLSQTIANGIVPFLTNTPDLAEEAENLSKIALKASSEKAINALTASLKKFWFKLEMRSGDNEELHEGTLRLLKLIIENISELLLDDQWLKGQLAVVQEIISNPMKPSVIDDAERSLKAVIYKQSMLKHSLTEAKTSIKNMIASFIDRLGEFSTSTGEYHQKIDTFSKELSQTDDITKISHILGEVMKETKSVQLSTLKSRDEVLDAQDRVSKANQRITELESELENLSEMVKEDQLTRTLNRRGLEQAFEREASRADRRNLPLCLAVLDIDDFKKLNDTLGHHAGDSALVHFSSVIKEAVRPNDTVSRFGGEEFLIILPDSDLDNAVQVVTRLQRDLTKKFFLHDNQKLVITFSGGVAMREPHESRDSLIERADKAMYVAKKTGKNRVVAAPSKEEGS